MRSFQYTQSQWSSDATQLSTPAGGFHGQSTMGGSSDYEATDSGPSMSYSPGPSSYSTSVPNTAVETPHTMLLPSIPSSTMGSNTTAQVSKTIHKNIPTIQKTTLAWLPAVAVCKSTTVAVVPDNWALNFFIRSAVTMRLCIFLKTS